MAMFGSPFRLVALRSAAQRHRGMLGKKSEYTAMFGAPFRLVAHPSPPQRQRQLAERKQRFIGACRRIDMTNDPESDPSGDVLPRGALFGGFLRPDRAKQRRRTDRVPPEGISCACGSRKSYGRCCMQLHTGARPAAEGEELLRARYSAFSYRLPGFIMRTTSRMNSDYRDDWIAWEQEILEFCDAYKFIGLEILEDRQVGPDVHFILFRATLLQLGEPGFFVERSRFVRERDKWMYASGKLVESERLT